MKKTAHKSLVILLTLLTFSACKQSKEPDWKFTLESSALPAFEDSINHAGLIKGLDDDAFDRGENIYANICFNCHGNKDQPGSLPTAQKFWEQPFKAGADPYAMYQVITRGLGAMPPQVQLSPREKYDVIHFIREEFVKKQHAEAYEEVEESYLAALPEGTSQGPDPKPYKPWYDMDYGDFLMYTYELAGKDTPPRNMSGGRSPLPDEDFSWANFAYKGIAVRLDEGPGGVSKGNAWMIFDHDVMRMAGGWTGDGFIDWEAILLNDRHNIHPRTIGQLHFQTPVGPGWANPENGSFEDPRFTARDGRKFGPLPRKWTHYKGLYRYGEKIVISYTVGEANVLELPGGEKVNDTQVFTRTLKVSASPVKLKMRVAPEKIQVKLIGTGVALAVEGGYHVVEIPAGKATHFKLLLSETTLDGLDETSNPGLVGLPENLDDFIQGGPSQYDQELTTPVIKGDRNGPFAVDVLSIPFDNPWKSRMRVSGVDFFNDKNKAVVCATEGDVWLVEGLTAENGILTWRRIATGLFQPLGIKVIEEEVYVTCRDQIVILRDLNNDGETDFYESFNSDHQVTDHFHEFAMGLQTDDQGNLYYAKSGRHAREALIPQHGTLLKVSKDGEKTEIIATGFRAANGVCLNPDGTFVVTDQEGFWNPMNRVNWVKGEGRFYGNMFGYNPPADSSDTNMEQPLVWVDKEIDRSPSELLWVDSEKWGSLNGSLLNLSYGYGTMHIVPHEEVDGQMQGGIFQLPVPRFATGVMRGRFNPGDGNLYVCGMSAWATNQTIQPGGFYRVVRTEKALIVPKGLNVTKKGVKITFTEALDSEEAVRLENYQVKTWVLHRTRNYGSDRYDIKDLSVKAAVLDESGKVLELEIPEISPVWQMEIKYELKDKNGEAISGTIQNTIHKLGD